MVLCRRGSLSCCHASLQKAQYVLAALIVLMRCPDSSCLYCLNADLHKTQQTRLSPTTLQRLDLQSSPQKTRAARTHCPKHGRGWGSMAATYMLCKGTDAAGCSFLCMNGDPASTKKLVLESCPVLCPSLPMKYQIVPTASRRHGSAPHGLRLLLTQSRSTDPSSWPPFASLSACRLLDCWRPPPVPKQHSGATRAMR